MPEINAVTPVEVKTEPSAQSITPLPQPKPEESIVSRVANFKPSEPAPKPIDQPVFNASDFDKIASVDDAKRYAQNAHKELERTFQKKFQDIAELRKTLESQIKAPVRDEWTPEKVKAEMQKPSFLAAANDVLKMSKPVEDEYSSLSEWEKQKLNEIDVVKQQNQLLLQEHHVNALKRMDEEIKSRYPNYNPNAVDMVMLEVAEKKVSNPREYAWKIADYESAVNRAYQLGRQDERGKITENNQGASFEGINSPVSTSIPMKRDKGESNESFLRRLYSHAVSSVKS